MTTNPTAPTTADLLQKQQHAWIRLRQYFESSARPPAAFMVTGSEVGFAHQLVRYFFQFRECKQASHFLDSSLSTPMACESCSTCLRIATQRHPDWIELNPNEDSFSVDHVRNLKATLVYPPYEAISRFVVISNANRLTPAATNALLKTLEEPPTTTVFFLLTTEADSLLPTIRSRCQSIRLIPNVGADPIPEPYVGQLAPELSLRALNNARHMMRARNNDQFTRNDLLALWHTADLGLRAAFLHWRGERHLNKKLLSLALETLEKSIASSAMESSP